MKMNRIVICVLASAGIASLVPSASASTIIFQRGLPSSTNVNSAAGANQSNISWGNQSANGTVYLVGDDIDLSQSPVPNSTGSWSVDSISVFEVANTPISTSTSTTPPAAALPQNEFSSLTLFEGTAYTTLTPISSTYTSQFVQYEPAGVNYEVGTDGFFPIYEITFSGLNLVVPANADLGFAIDAVPNDSNGFFLHASNAALSGTEQDGADNFYENYCTNTSVPQGATSAAYCALIDSNGDGWTKSSDINVVVTGAPSSIPEPATFGLLGAGILAIVALRKRLA